MDIKGQHGQVWIDGFWGFELLAVGELHWYAKHHGES